MNLSTFGFILTGVLLNACAQLLLKAGTKATGAITLSLDTLIPTAIKLATAWPIIGGLICYVISVVVWIVGLSRVDVTIAYPLLSLGYVVNAFLAWYLFGEVLTTQRLLGIGIILVGVYVLARS